MNVVICVSTLPLVRGTSRSEQTRSPSGLVAVARGDLPMERQPDTKSVRNEKALWIQEAFVAQSVHLGAALFESTHLGPCFKALRPHRQNSGANYPACRTKSHICRKYVPVSRKQVTHISPD